MWRSGMHRGKGYQADRTHIRANRLELLTMAHGAYEYLSFPPAPDLYNGYSRRQMWEAIIMTSPGPGTAVGASELIMSRGFFLSEKVNSNMSAVHAPFPAQVLPEDEAGKIISELA